MDYDRKNLQNETPDFFTTGAGSNNEKLNNFEPENNLDLSNSQAEWQVNNAGNIGSKIMGVLPKEQKDISSDARTSRVGQVIELKGTKTQNPAQISTETTAQSPYRKAAIKTGGRFSEEGITETDTVIRQFENGDVAAADFYDTVRNMMEDNLDNSYDRKLAA